MSSALSNLLHRLVSSITARSLPNVGHGQPWRRLPSKTWSDIFSINTEAGFYLAPLSLMLVCRSWKAIVLNTPRLWSSIRVEVPRSRTKKLDAKANWKRLRTIRRMGHGAALWIRRSGSCRLTVELIDRNQEVHDLLLGPFLNALIKNASRISILSLELSHSIPALEKLQGRLQSLEAAFINMRRNNVGAAIKPIKFLKDAPDLYFVSLSEIVVSIHLPYSQLQCVQVNSNEDALQVIKHSPPIPKLDIIEPTNYSLIRNHYNSQYWIGPMSYERREEKFVLTKLQSLTIEATEEFEKLDLLDCMTCPSLKRLNLKADEYADRFLKFHLPSFLSACSLTFLDIEIAFTDRESKNRGLLESILQTHLPKLTDLIYREPQRRFEAELRTWPDFRLRPLMAPFFSLKNPNNHILSLLQNPTALPQLKRLTYTWSSERLYHFYVKVGSENAFKDRLAEFLDYLTSLLDHRGALNNNNTFECLTLDMPYVNVKPIVMQARSWKELGLKNHEFDLAGSNDTI